MTKVSRKPLRKDKEQEIYQILFSALAKLNSSEEIAIFLEDLLTPTEKLMLSKRLYIAILLSRGFTYEMIMEGLNVSSVTINSVNFWLKHGKAGYQNAMNKIIRQEKIEAFLDKFEESLLRAFPKKFKSAAYFRKQQAGREIYLRRKNRLFIK